VATYGATAAARVGVNGYSVGVPATLRAVDEMLRRWGTMSLTDVLREPTQLAEDGVPVGTFLASASREPRTLSLQPETIATFRRADGTPLQAGDTIVQHNLAKTFRLIGERGVDVFYNGEIAGAIVHAQKRLSPTTPIGGEGRMTLADLAKLRVTVEKPLSLDYDGTLLHPALESMRLAFADRDMWIGDDDVVDVPETGLLSDAYLTDRSSLIRLDGRIANPTWRRGIRGRTTRPPCSRKRKSRRKAAATRRTSPSSTSGATQSR
jgi:gamma-glutamyltranspeptidase/glutathione hydrolase